MTTGKTAKISPRYTKLRLIQFGVAEALLALGLLVTFRDLPGTLFWPLTAGLVIPALFAEPYFTGPRPAVATAVAQIGSYFSSDHSRLSNLWTLLIVASVVVGVSALYAILRDTKPGQVSHWVSTRLGRAIVLGSVVTVILLLQVASKDPGNAGSFAVVIVALYGVLFLDWSKLTIKPLASLPDRAVVSAAFAPNQLLINSGRRLKLGTRLRIVGTAGSSEAYVAEDLASVAGSEYRVVLSNHWRDVTDASNLPCTVELLAEDDRQPRGFAIEGSTEITLRVSPLADIKMGETLEMIDDVGPLLYQVSGLDLQNELWSGGSALVARIDLVQIGAVDQSGMIVARPALPKPYSPIYSALDTEMPLDQSYMRIGTLKGTSIPVGIKRDWLSNNGHLALLGMSGMGKTTVASKLSFLAKEDDKFVILDETSEYRTRLGFGVTQTSDLDWGVGDICVCEPGGEMPEACEKLIKSAMNAAHAEYVSGALPKRRFILLEEAHGWLPEWNFTSRANADAVNRCCRYILQARKFNITFIMVSQRTAVISKSAISQCENYIILRTLDQTSLEYVEGVIGTSLKSIVSELGKYEAVCVGPIFNSDAPIIVSLDSPV